MAATFSALLCMYHLWGNWYVQCQAFLKGLLIICVISVSPHCENFPGRVLLNTLHAWPTTPVRVHPKGLCGLFQWVSAPTSWYQLCKIYRFHIHSKVWLFKWWYCILSECELISTISCMLAWVRLNIIGCVYLLIQIYNGEVLSNTRLVGVRHFDTSDLEHWGCSVVLIGGNLHSTILNTCGLMPERFTHPIAIN